MNDFQQSVNYPANTGAETSYPEGQKTESAAGRPVRTIDVYRGIAAARQSCKTTSMNPTSTPSNPFAVAAVQSGAAVQTAQGEIMQHLQAGYVMAARRPRDQHAAYQRIIEACKRQGLAEESSYLYARGGTQITGASIRLLESIFTCWGNVASGVIELSQSNGESQMMSFATDFETNCFDFKIFTVRHERYSKAGVAKLDDPTDIYLHVANFAARRKRTSMEAIVPRDIIDAALEQCDKTLKAGHAEPITDRIRKMATVFAEHGVTVEMLERRLQHKLDACIEQELVLLRKIFTSLKDGMGKREDFFDVTAAPKPAKFEDVKADEKAEAAAGLAPSTPAPAVAPAPPGGEAERLKKLAAQERMAKARAAKKSAMAAPPVEPAPEPPPPAPASPAPAGELFSPPAAPPADSNALAAQVYAMLGTQNITEAETLKVLKNRSIIPANVEQLVQVSDEILADLLENAPIIAAQVRIDRKAAGRK